MPQYVIFKIYQICWWYSPSGRMCQKIHVFEQRFWASKLKLLLPTQLKVKIWKNLVYLIHFLYGNLPGLLGKSISPLNRGHSKGCGASSYSIVHNFYTSWIMWDNKFCNVQFEISIQFQYDILFMKIKHPKTLVLLRKICDNEIWATEPEMNRTFGYTEIPKEWRFCQWWRPGREFKIC